MRSKRGWEADRASSFWKRRADRKDEQVEDRHSDVRYRKPEGKYLDSERENVRETVRETEQAKAKPVARE